MEQISLSKSEKVAYFSEVSKCVQHLNSVWLFMYDHRDLFPSVDYDFDGMSVHLENSKLRLDLNSVMLFFSVIRSNLLYDE